MDSLKKELVFYFYVTDDFFERKTNLVHLECLKRYAHVFDNSTFYISVDDVNNTELIRRVEQKLLSLPFNGNISFVVHKNDDLRESAVFSKELIDKIKNDDCLLFFGHGKGFTNLDVYEERSMLQWLVGCYYLSLNVMDNVERAINSNERTWITYGSFPLFDQRKYTPEFLAEPGANLYLGRIKYHWCYSGTFFWINTPRLRGFIKMFDIEYPDLYDRYYSEKFLGNMIPQTSNATGHNNFLLYAGNNMYNDGVAEECIKAILKDENSIKEYYDFYNEVTNV